MGFKVDFGSDNGGSKAPLAGGQYTAELLNWQHGTSKNGKIYVEPVFGNVQDGQDRDGNDWGKRRVWAHPLQLRFYPEAAGWALKKFATGLGIEIPEEAGDVESVEELVEILNETFAGEYSIEVTEDEYNGKPNSKVTEVS